jgi:hypothetical protein
MLDPFTVITRIETEAIELNGIFDATPKEVFLLCRVFLLNNYHNLVKSWLHDQE